MAKATNNVGKKHTSKNVFKKVRTPHPEEKVSNFNEILPKSPSLDWFNPEYFDDLPAQTQMLYYHVPIALPLEEK